MKSKMLLTALAMALVPLALASDKSATLHVIEFDFIAKKWTYKRNGVAQPSIPRVFRDGETIEYRVVNINPFLYRVEGKNDLTLFQAPELSEDLRNFASGRMAAAAKGTETGRADTADPVHGNALAAPSEQEPGVIYSALAKIVKDSRGTIRVSRLETNFAPNSTSNVVRELTDSEKIALSAQAKGEARFRTDVVSVFKVSGNLEELTDAELSSFVVRVRNLAGETGRLTSSMTTLTASEVRAINDGIVEAMRRTLAEQRRREIKAFEDAYNPMADRLKEAGQAAKKVGDVADRFGSRASLYQQLLADRKLEPGPGEISGAATLSKIQDRIRKSASAAGFDPDKPEEFGRVMAASTEEAKDGASEVQRSTTSLATSAKTLADERTSMKVGQEGALENSLLMLDLLQASDDPSSRLLARIETVRIQSLREAIAQRSKEIGQATKVAGAAGGIAKASEEIGKLVIAKEEGAKTDTQAARELYDVIRGTASFELVASMATMTRASGTVKYTLNVYRTDGKEKVDVFGTNDPEFSYEVMDRHAQRVEFGASYVFGRTGARDYRLQSQGTEPQTWKSQDLGDKGWDVSSAVLFGHYRFNPENSNSWAGSFGVSTSFDRLFFGASYCVGRTSGLTITGGMSLGQIDVLRFPADEIFRDENAAFTRKDWRWGGPFFALGFRF